MNERSLELLRTVAALLLSFAVAAIIILSISTEPLEALRLFLTGPLQTLRRFGNVIEMMIPLIFTGLGVSLIFQSSQFNLSAAGVFIISAVFTTLVAIFVPLPPYIGPLVALLTGACTGALFSTIPGILKLKWDTSVIVSSLMLNYIFYNLTLYIINNYAKDVSSGAWFSYKFQPTTLLPRLIPGTRVHWGLILALLMVFAAYYFLYRSKWGYAIRMVGLNPDFSRYAGIHVMRTALLAQFIGGAIIGLGGATELLGMYQRYQWQIMPAYGWDGIIVALIARNNPAYVLLASGFLAYIRIGADIMSRYTDVPAEVIMIVNAVIILIITAEKFLSSLYQKQFTKKYRSE